MKHSITREEYKAIKGLWDVVQKSIEEKTSLVLPPEIVNNTKTFIASCELGQLSSDCVYLWGHDDHQGDHSSTRVSLGPSSTTSRPPFAFDDFIMASHTDYPFTSEAPCWLVIRRMSGCNWRMNIWHSWYLIYIYAKPQADKDGVLYCIDPEGRWFFPDPALINLSGASLQEMHEGSS